MNRPIIIVICLLLSLVSGIFLPWPEYRKLQGQKSEVTQKKTELQTLKDYFAELNALSEELKESEYEIALSKIDSALPSEFFLPSLLNYLQKTASENGLILNSFGKVASGLSGLAIEVKEFHLDLGLSGSYSALKDFLSVLEKNARLIGVENISFSFPGKEKPFNFLIKIKVYSY